METLDGRTRKGEIEFSGSVSAFGITERVLTTFPLIKASLHFRLACHFCMRWLWVRKAERGLLLLLYTKSSRACSLSIYRTKT